MQWVVVEWEGWDIGEGGGMGDGFGLGYGLGGQLRRLWFVGATTCLTFVL